MLLKKASLSQKHGLLLLMQQRVVWRRSKISHLGNRSVLTASGSNKAGSHHPASFTHAIACPDIPTGLAQGLVLKDAGSCFRPSSVETIIRRSVSQ